MKHIIKSRNTIPLVIMILSALMIGCKPSTESPEDLEGLKKAVSEKKSQVKTLQGEIDAMLVKIEKLEPAAEKKTSLVTLETIEKETLNRFATLQASVMSDELVNPSSEIGGRLLSVRVKEGDYVKKGQLIATVDTDILDKQVAELNTKLNLATTVFEKQKTLWDQNIGSEIQFLQAKNNKESIEKSLETMQAQLGKKNVYAPVSGAVDREFLKAGELASPGMPIVSILNTNKLKVTADVPENYLTKVKRGDKVTINFPALDKEIERKITLVGRSIDPSNRTFKIEMDTDNYKGMLKPNLLAEVKINDLTLKDAIMVPTELIQQEVDGKEYIYAAETMGDKMVAKKHYVETGDVINGEIQVVSGLKEGDKIVVLGARTIAEGDFLIDENGK